MIDLRNTALIGLAGLTVCIVCTSMALASEPVKSAKSGDSTLHFNFTGTLLPARSRTPAPFRVGATTTSAQDRKSTGAKRPFYLPPYATLLPEPTAADLKQKIVEPGTAVSSTLIDAGVSGKTDVSAISAPTVRPSLPARKPRAQHTVSSIKITNVTPIHADKTKLVEHTPARQPPLDNTQAKTLKAAARDPLEVAVDPVTGPLSDQAKSSGIRKPVNSDHASTSIATKLEVIRKTPLETTSTSAAPGPIMPADLEAQTKPVAHRGLAEASYEIKQAKLTTAARQNEQKLTHSQPATLQERKAPRIDNAELATEASSMRAENADQPLNSGRNPRPEADQIASLPSSQVQVSHVAPKPATVPLPGAKPRRAELAKKSAARQRANRRAQAARRQAARARAAKAQQAAAQQQAATSSNWALSTLSSN